MTIERKKEIFEWIIKNHPDSCFALSYKDDEVDEFSPEASEIVNHFYITDLKLCGCGYSMLSKKCIMHILRRIANEDCYITHDSEEVKALKDIVLKLLDNHGFIYHGSSIYSCSITDKGKMFLDALEDMLSPPDSDSVLR